MTGNKIRFSKSSLRETIEARIGDLKREYDFDERNGWDQVKRRPVDVIVAYGRFDAYLDLLDDLQ